MTEANKVAPAIISPATLRLYKVMRVEKSEPPDGASGRHWHRYILENGRSTITGHREGSHKDVLAYATLCAEQLNTRGVTAQSIWSPRGRKPANAVNNTNTT
jgi:hypothetical protein